MIGVSTERLTLPPWVTLRELVVVSRWRLMVKRRTRTRIGAATVAVVALVAMGSGCRSDDATTVPTPTSSGAAGSTTPVKTERPASPLSVEEDTELAEKARLEPADLPGAWTQPTGGTPSSSSSSQDAFTCADPPPGFELITSISSGPRAKTPRISETGTSRRITEEVDVLATVDEASRLMAALRDPRFPTCMTDAIDTMMKALGPLAKGNPGSIAPVDPTAAGVGEGGSVPAGSSGMDGFIKTIEVPTAGDEVIGLEVALFLQGGSNQKPTYTVFVRIDRIVAVITIDGDAAPTPDEMHVFAAAAETKARKTLEDF
jgi:hypothetical protein